MTTADLLAQHAEAWRRAVRHPFLDGVRDGTLPRERFDRWLAQDYRFVEAQVRVMGRTLAVAPRRDLAVLLAGLSGAVAELGWFEERATARGVELAGPLAPGSAAYLDFLHALAHRAYAVQLTALWALERAYLDAWSGARPGGERYGEFVEHWTTDEFRAYVDDLARLTDAALAAADGDARREAAEAFARVAELEAGFWSLAG